MKHLEQEKIKFYLKKQEDKFYKFWETFIDHFNNTEFSDNG